MTVHDLPTIVGAVLVIVGIVLTGYQVLTTKGGKPVMRGASAGPWGIRIRRTTTYPGLIMIGLGVVLLLVGNIGR
jgi:uncharacterized membrane protein